MLRKSTYYGSITLLSIFLIIVLITKNVSSSLPVYNYVTYEGVVIGLDEKEVIIFINDQEEVFTLSGPLARQVAEAGYRKFIITGKNYDSTIPQVCGDIYVETYQFLEPSISKLWIVGTVYEAAEGTVIVGDDQIIYYIKSSRIFERLKNKKVITVVTHLDKWIDECTIRVYNEGALFKILDME